MSKKTVNENRKRDENGHRNGAGRAVICAVIFVLCCAAAFALWSTGGFFALGGEADPARWQTRTALRDMDGDGRTEAFVLENRRMTVFSEDEEIWASDSQWQVEDFLMGDLGGDGTEELVLFVWKRGSYGPVRPFWVEADETGYSQHIFLYRWESGELEPLWMSSGLTPEVREWELLSDGSLKLLTEAGEETRWGWHNWGLERLDGERKPF